MTTSFTAFFNDNDHLGKSLVSYPFEGSSWYISHNAIYREIEQDNLGVKRIDLNIYFVAVGTPNQRGLN